jgi:hypothetical protein
LEGDPADRYRNVQFPLQSGSQTNAYTKKVTEQSRKTRGVAAPGPLGIINPRRSLSQKDSDSIVLPSSR